MKNILILIFLLTSSIIISSCIEDDSPEIYTLTGTLFYDCNKVPMANTSLILMGYDGSVFQEDLTGVKGSTTTDENGNFSISYEKQPIRVDIFIENINGINSRKIIGGITNNQNIDLGNIYFANTGRLIVKLDVKEHYTNQDTLFFGPGIGRSRYIIGPFSSGIIDTIPISNSIQFYDLDLLRRQTGGNYETSVSWHLYEKWGVKYFIPIGCEGYDEMLIELK